MIFAFHQLIFSTYLSAVTLRYSDSIVLTLVYIIHRTKSTEVVVSADYSK